MLHDYIAFPLTDQIHRTNLLIQRDKKKIKKSVSYDLNVPTTNCMLSICGGFTLDPFFSFLFLET